MISDEKIIMIYRGIMVNDNEEIVAEARAYLEGLLVGLSDENRMAIDNDLSATIGEVEFLPVAENYKEKPNLHKKHWKHKVKKNSWERRK
jgi:hypothetical protein